MASARMLPSCPSYALNARFETIDAAPDRSPSQFDFFEDSFVSRQRIAGVVPAPAHVATLTPSPPRNKAPFDPTMVLRGTVGEAASQVARSAANMVLPLMAATLTTASAGYLSVNWWKNKILPQTRSDIKST